MKRTLQILLLASMASTLGAASAAESKVETAKESVTTTAVTTDLPDIPQCRGALSQDLVNIVQAATQNPRKALERMRRQGTGNWSKASVECAGRLWQALNPKLTRAEWKAAARLARTSEMRREGAEASRERTVSGPLSPAGKRALSREDAEHEFVADDAPYTGPHVDHRPVHAIRTPPLRKVHPIPPPRRGDGDGEGHVEPVRPIPPTEVGGPDGPRQIIEGATISAPTPAAVAFDGIGVGLGGFSPSSNPPDVNGRVGGTQYVQWNNSSFAIFSKTTGALLYGPAAGNTLFQSLGGVCATHNDGDPVVSYDLLAGRWVLSQFVVGASPNASHQCFAVSVTDDALGSYYLYDFVTDPTNFVDYPHTGVWPDGYYMTTHVFNAGGTAQVAARVHVFERDKMILGLPARQVQKDLRKDGSAFQYGFVPADLDSTTPPPAGEPSFILGPNGQFTNRTDSTRVAVTWGVTPTITLTEATITTVGIVSPACVSNTNGRDCVPQPSPAVAADYLDNISFHYMYRLAYRNFGGSPVQESLVVSAPTAGSASTPGHGAIKWIEFRNAGGLTTTPTVFQSGTFDPDTAYRWLPSIAMDKDHNIALGYSKSSTSIKPGIYMTGRLGTDTINTMGAETTVQAGIGSQTTGAGNRWGDYSAMTLDPIDQCTFWYTNEYLKTNGAFNWSTRVATYKFPSCTAAAAWGTISGTITSCATGAPLSGVVVTLSNGYAGASDASGNYTISVPAGTYSASAADADRNCTSGSPATVSVISTSGGTTNQNFCMSGTSNLQTNGLTIDDASNGNNNGIVNRNECVKLNIPLKNNGCATETAISATLTTATAGVTVTQANSTYSNLVIDASSVNATPYQFQTSNSFVCGTVINFTLTVTYASGNKVLGISIPTCAGGANQTIPSSSLTAADLTQADRLGRDGVPSTCAGKVGSGGFAGTKYYKAFTFTNNSGTAACYTVTINAALGGAGDIQSEAYSPTYNPAAITTNLLGDSGIVGLGTTVGSVTYSFTVPALTNFVVVVNTAGTTTSSVFSGTVSGFVDNTAGPGACPACTPPPTPTITPGGPTTFCAGGSVTLTSSSATGNQWYNGVTLLAGQTNQNYIATTSGNYNVVATVAGCPSAPSASTAVTVNPIPATPTVTPGGPTTFCSGGSVTLTSSSATGNQWYNGVTLLAGQTNQTYVATTSGNYNVIVTASGCSSAPSSSTAVTVNPAPATPTVTPGGPTTFCAGGSVTLTSSSATGNQWYNGVTLLAGQTNQTYVATTTGNYNVIVTTAGCPSAPSTSTAVTVNPIPATPTVTPGGPTTFCTGGSVTLTSSSATGNQWYDGVTLLAGQTNQAYVATTTGNYNVIVTASGCSSAPSSSTAVTVNPIPATPTVTPGGPTTFCSGGSVTLTSSSASGNQWYNGVTLLVGQTNQTYVATTSGNYNVVVTTAGCSSAPSTSTAVTVNPTPATPTITPGGPTTFCTGGSVTLTSSSASGNQWYDGVTLLVGQTNQAYVATTTGNYNVIVTASGCSSAPSASTSVTVNPIPATPTVTSGGPTTFCTGGSVTLTSSSASGNQWYNGVTLLVGQTNQAYVATTSGNYNVVVTTNGCSSSPSASTAVTVNPTPATPTITPSGPTTFCTGGSVTLTSSSATGNQWFNGLTPLAGETNQTYVATTSGNYNVVVTTNGCSSAPSASTAVTVNPIPATPTVTPSGPTTFCSGGSVTLTSSSAAGNQWYDGVTLLAGETNQTYLATTSGNYNVVVTANGCSSAPSTSTSVTVNPTPATPTITPSGPTTFCTGGSVTLTSSSATGNQWFNGLTPLAGETNQNYIATTSGNYNVVVTANGCSSAPSASTAVTVNPIPATPTVTPGGPTTFCTGGSVMLTSSSATGNQWFNGLTPLVGETNQNYIATTSGNYNVVVTTNGCSSAPSASTAVTVNPTPATPTITPGGPTTFCTGGSVTLTSSSATGNQWFNGLTPLAGETNQNYIATTSGNYNVVVTTNGCASAPSASTAVTVNPIPATPTVTPGGPTTFCAGGSVTLTSSSATGNQWFNGLTPLAGETNQNYIATTSGNYNVVVTTNGCPSAPSASTAVTVNPIPATPTVTPGGPTTFCTGGSVTLTSSSATGNQWFNGLTPLAGETNQNYIATTSGNYNVVVTTNGCSSAPSASTAVTVNPTPATPTITPGGPTTFCTGGSVTLTSSSATGNQWFNGLTPLAGETNQNYIATTSGNYNVVVTTNGCPSAPSASTAVTVNPIPATPTVTPGGPTTFCTGGSVTLTSSSATGNQWFNGLTPLAGETNQNYIATTSGNYNVVVTTNGCSSAPSASTAVTVNPVPATPTVTPGGPTTFCAGGSVTLTSSSATGNQWYDGLTPLAGETNQNYIATTSGNYNVVVTASGCSSAHSASTAVTVNPTPATPTITPGGATTFCTGGSVTLTSSSATGNQWYDGLTLLAGETNQIYIASSTGNYNVVVTASGCSSAHSASTIVTVNPTPATPTVTPGGPTTFCAGGSVTLTSSSASGNQWYNGVTPLAGETNQNYIATTSGNYNVVVTANGCSSAPSASTSVTVTPAPATPTITPGGPTTFCTGGSVTLTSSSASGNQWYLNGNPIGGATAQQYIATAGGSYTVIVTAACPSAPSAATVVTVNPIPATPTISPAGQTAFCEGGSVVLTSSSATGNQWYRNGVAIGGETAQTHVATTGGNYTVTVTANGCTSAASEPTLVLVNPKPDATITVTSPMFSGASATASVAISCGGAASFVWTITGGTITDGAGTPTITFTAGPAGTLTIQVTVTTAAGCSDTKSVNVTVQNATFGPPPAFQASASGTTSANLTWAPVLSADHYEIHRSTDNVSWTLRGTSGGTTFSEGGLTPSTTYFYKVRTVKADSTLSAFSAIDPATMMVFTDDPLPMCGAIVKAVHITQLRTAVNIARAAIGLSAFSFTDPSLAPGAPIKAVHMSELRTALAPLLTAIGVTPSYTDPTITAGVTTVKAAHVRKLRDLIR